MNGPTDEATDFSGVEPPADEVLAGEYVLGVLDSDTRQQIQARIAIDADFARQVDRWERHLHGLLAEVPDAQVPDVVWAGISSRLGWARPAAGRPGPWRSLAFWRGATALMAAVAIAAIVVGRAPTVSLRPAVEERAARPVTPLAQDDGRPAWLASVNSDQGTVLMVPVPAPPDARGRVPELWLIAPGQAPRSLGLVSIDQSHTVLVPQDLRQWLASGTTLAVTLEPQGGAPQGAPTGPIIAKGEITRG